jgi:hypothetical protein
VDRQIIEIVADGERKRARLVSRSTGRAANAPAGQAATRQTSLRVQSSRLRLTQH